MSPVDALSPDQRAVVQLLLKQGKSYDELATLLRIAPEAVRQRAHAALDALGAQAGVAADLPDDRRAQVADWLLGQEDDADAWDTLVFLRESRPARVWARAVARQLEPVADGGLPEIPAEPDGGDEVDEGERVDEEPEAEEPDGGDGDGDGDGEEPEDEDEEPEAAEAEPAADDEPKPKARPLPGFAPAPAGDGVSGAAFGTPQRSSRLGGALLLAGVAIVIAVVVVLLVSRGDDGGGTAGTTATTTQTAQASTTATTPSIIGQVNLTPPGGGKALGVANILEQGSQRALAIQAQELQANTKRDAYAVWLTDGPNGKVTRLGFAPAVGKDRRLQGVAALPSDASGYKRLELSLETQNDPQRPGQVVLRGPFRLGG